MAARYKPTNLIFRISYESNNEKTRAGVQFRFLHVLTDEVMQQAIDPIVISLLK